MNNLRKVLEIVEEKQTKAKAVCTLTNDYLNRLDEIYGSCINMGSLQTAKDLIAIEYTQTEQAIINSNMIKHGLCLAF